MFLEMHIFVPIGLLLRIASFIITESGSKIKECPEGQKLIHINGLLPFCGDPNKHLD